MKTVEILDLAKTRAGLPSDYALARRLGVTPQAVSSWRSSTRPRYPEVLHACLLAEICALDPMKVLADIEMDKAEHYSRTNELSAWRNLLNRAVNGSTEYRTKAGTVITGIFLAGSLLTPPAPVNASSLSPMRNGPAEGGDLCILCKLSNICEKEPKGVRSM